MAADLKEVIPLTADRLIEQLVQTGGKTVHLLENPNGAQKEFMEILAVAKQAMAKKSKQPAGAE